MNAVFLLCAGRFCACVDIHPSAADEASAPRRPAVDASAETATSDSAEATTPETNDSGSNGRHGNDGGNRQGLSSNGNDAASGTPDSSMDTATNTPPAAMGKGQALGQVCSDAEGCGSGHCVNEVCCEVKDCGICGRCGTGGRCEKVVNDFDYKHCQFESAWCNEASECVLLEGDLCGGVRTPPCLSGICDGVCCKQTCGSCQRCARSGSGCEPIAYVDDRDSCHDDHTCHRPGQCASVAAQQTSNTEDIVVEQVVDKPIEQYAQTFTLASAAKLIGLRVEGCSPLGTWALNAVDRAGLPTNSVVAAASPAEASPSARDLTLSYDAAAGARLAIVASFGAEIGCNFFIGSGDPYPEGQLFHRVTEDAPWSPLTGKDLVFKVIAE